MQELTASNETSMRSVSGCRGRRLCDRRCSVDRTSCDIGRDRRGSRSKELRIAAMCTSRHSSCGQLQGSVGISVCRGRKTIGSGSSGRLCSVARGGESGWRRHMSSGGSHPNAGMITRNGFPGGSQPGLALSGGGGVHGRVQVHAAGWLRNSGQRPRALQSVVSTMPCSAAASLRSEGLHY